MTQTIDQPYVPTLHSGTGNLTSLPEMAVYILRAILSNPGKAYQASEHECGSIRQLIYQYEQDPDKLISELQNLLDINMKTLLKLPSKNESVQIGCDYKFHKDYAKYDIVISIQGLEFRNGQLEEFYRVMPFEITPEKILKLKLRGNPYDPEI